MGTTTGALPWAEWIIDRYIGKSVNSAHFQVHHKDTKAAASIEQRDLYLPEELEAQLTRQGASVKNYSDYYLSVAAGKLQIAQELKNIRGIVSVDEFKAVPNIKSGYTLFIRRPYVKTLKEYLEDETLTLQDYAKGVVFLCDAVSACHKQSVVFGGIRPDAVYVTDDKHFMLGTENFFALSRFDEKIDRFYLNGLTDSAAPETLNKGECTPLSDVYELGLLLYYFFNENKIPFLPLTQKKRNDHIYQGAIERRLGGEALLPPAHGTEEMKKVILKACEFDPEKRYASVEELKKELSNLIFKDLVSDIKPKEEDDDDIDDSEATEDYKAEMASRIRAEEARKQRELAQARAYAAAADDDDDDKQPKKGRTKKVRILAGVALVIMLVVQVIGMFNRGGGGRAQQPQTEVQTEAATEAVTEAATEAVTEAATEAVTEAVTEAATEAVTEAATEVATETATEAK